MQTYATPSDFIATFGADETVRLTATFEAPTVIDDQVLQGALERASVRVDACTSARYPAGFHVVPRLLIVLTCDLARYDLSTTAGRVLSDDVASRKEEADKLLRMVADGRVKLGLDTQDRPVDWTNGVQRLPTDTTLRDALGDY